MISSLMTSQQVWKNTMEKLSGPRPYPHSRVSPPQKPLSSKALSHHKTSSCPAIPIMIIQLCSSYEKRIKKKKEGRSCPAMVAR
jgi:hypothetical protein